MFDWIKKLFGEGKVHIEFVLTDGRCGYIKFTYIGQYNESEILKDIKSKILVAYGVQCTSLKIVGHTSQAGK